MTSKRDNIEGAARDICEREMQSAGWDEDEIPRLVDRLCHAVMASLGAGIIEDSGKERLHTLDEGLAAYRQWRAENPDYTPPPLRDDDR